MTENNFNSDFTSALGQRQAMPKTNNAETPPRRHFRPRKQHNQNNVVETTEQATPQENTGIKSLPNKNTNTIQNANQNAVQAPVQQNPVVQAPVQQNPVAQAPNQQPAGQTRTPNQQPAGQTRTPNQQLAGQTRAPKQNGLARNLQGKTHQAGVNNNNPRRNYTPQRNKPFSPVFNDKAVKIIPLGGIGEIGKNMTVYEYENDIIIVDCGLIFPDSDMHGIDLVLPDYTYLKDKKDKIRGVVLTHGHEDHIGALPYFLKDLNVPVYGTNLTIGLVKGKLTEHRILKSSKLNVVKAGDTIKLGVFSVEFIGVNHSIPDAVSLAISTPVGMVVQTGDFKVDYTPINEKPIDLIRFAEKGAAGVRLLLSDSTNAERPGSTSSESIVGKSFDALFARATKKRIIIATFASNAYRVQQIVNLAIKYNRKVAVSGRSMENVSEIARNLGYLHAPADLFVDIDKANRLNPENVVIVTTGSQGEPMAALSRMAADNHRKIKLSPDDFIIISAKPVPGNEKSVSRVINSLLKAGAEVVYDTVEKIHVSGHACADELRLMLNLTKPQFFLPVHGEQRQLLKHAELGYEMGIAKENVLIGSIGTVYELTENSFKRAGIVTSGRTFVDGLGVGDVGSVVLRDRKHLSEDGLIIVTITYDPSTGAFTPAKDVVSRGFVYVKESATIMQATRQNIVDTIEKCDFDNVSDWATIRTRVRDSLSHMIYQKTKRNPMILPIITEV